MNFFGSLNTMFFYFWMDTAVMVLSIFFSNNNYYFFIRCQKYLVIKEKCIIFVLRNKIITMTLKEAMTYMYHHPYVKMECGSWMFESKWVMWTGEEYGFMLSDRSEPDHFWWKEAISWGYDWWIKE